MSESGASKPRRLGRGLSALIETGVPVRTGDDPLQDAPGRGGISEPKPLTKSQAPAEIDAGDGRVFRELDPNIIQPNPTQPRQSFDESALETLGESIRRSGMMQPIVVRRSAEGYEIVAGERRWRAALRIGLGRVPTIEVSIDDREAAELALVENLQRRDLNPIERGAAFRRLSERFGASHEEIGTVVGLDRSSVTNLIRLTELEDEIQSLIVGGELGMGHGRALLSVSDRSRRVGLARRAAEEGWSVRRVEREASGKAASGSKPAGESAKNTPAPSFAVADLEQRLGEHLGTRVRIRTVGDGTKGAVSVEFFGLDHFDDLLRRIGFSQA